MVASCKGWVGPNMTVSGGWSIKDGLYLLLNALFLVSYVGAGTLLGSLVEDCFFEA